MRAGRPSVEVAALALGQDLRLVVPALDGQLVGRLDAEGVGGLGHAVVELLGLTVDEVLQPDDAGLRQDGLLLAPEGAGGKALVSGTKGSHIIIDNPRLLSALSGHMIYFENVDGREDAAVLAKKLEIES